MLKDIMYFILMLISPIIVTLICITIVMIIEIIIRLFKGQRIKKSESVYRKPSVVKRLFYDFPRQLVDDMFSRDPNEFREYGLHMFCGEQGSGKTISVVHILQLLKKKYPRVKIRTNMNYKYQDGTIEHWKDLVKNENGEYGQVEVLDEIQTWFSSMQSKDFPPEMLTEISQQRKQRKMLIGTAQVFSRIAKPIREQTTYVYLPMTLFGCLTIVRVSKPQYWDDENQVFKKYIRSYFFVHNKEIRNSFDTYQKIEKYIEDGFYSNNLKLAQ